MTRRVAPADGVNPFDPTDRYGRRSIPATAHLFTERRERKITAGRVKFHHRTRNGCFDPFSFFHVVETLLNLHPDTRFTGAALAEWMNTDRPTFIWDAVTLGRILNDLHDSFTEVNGEEHSPIRIQRAWDGTHYWVSGVPEHRTALANVLEDLRQAGEQLWEAEARGEPPKRLTSPLAACASMM